MGILHLWFLFNQVYFLFLFVFFNYTPCNVMPNMVIMFMKIFSLIPRVYCVKSVQIRSYFWSIFSCNQSEFRTIRTRNNSVFGHFSRSDMKYPEIKLTAGVFHHGHFGRNEIWLWVMKFYGITTPKWNHPKGNASAHPNISSKQRWQ